MKKLMILVLAALMVTAMMPSLVMADTFNTSADLIADGGDNPITIGTVNVSYDTDTNALQITYNLTGNWCLLETHLHVDLDGDQVPDYIPKTGSGNPKVGKFQYFKEDFTDPGTACESSWGITINQDGLEGAPVIIAAHAAVVDTTDALPENWVYESAWADGRPFALDRNWATYIFWDIPPLP